MARIRADNAARIVMLLLTVSTLHCAIAAQQAPVSNVSRLRASFCTCPRLRIPNRLLGCLDPVTAWQPIAQGHSNQ